MADKTYKMQVTLTDNRVLDAGTFVAPQGPQGPQGPAGASGGGNVQCFFLTTEVAPFTIVSPNGNTAGYAKRAKTGALTTFNSFTSVTFEDDVEYTFLINNATGKHIYITDDGSGGEPFVDYVAQKDVILVQVFTCFYESGPNGKSAFAIFYERD